MPQDEVIRLHVADGLEVGGKSNAGFTLIELIVVIVILGILAATALPKLVNIGTDARSASVQTMAGTLNTAVQLVNGIWQVRGGSGATVTMADGTTVSVNSATGIPTANAAGIGAAINCTAASCGGYTVNFGPFATTFHPSGGAVTGTCQAAYTAAGVVTPVTSGC